MAKKLTKEQIRKMLRGKAISNKDRKFFNKPLSKYLKAENGIEGTMGGLTDQGFNYNGAWGGPSMAMGGGIPGSVGFTYARTQGAAPSNGPYAKKTKPSAQNGMEMKYYQEGLDFKPKTISQDGSKTKKARQPKRVVVFAERPIGEDLDNKAFITEAENVKSFYKRTSPNTKVEVLPIYETGDLKTKQKIQNTLAGLSPEDDVMVFGHHGSKYAGIPTEQWATLLQDSNYGNCYLGSCQSEDVATGAWKNVRNLVYRPATPWKGFNPKGSDLISAMFSRGSTPPPSESEALYLPMPQRDQYESQAAFQRDLAEYERKVNEFNKRNRRTLDIEKPILGVDYKVKPNPPKYQSNAEWITNPLFSGSRQTGLPITLTAPTKKKKYGGWLEKYQDGGIIEDPMGQWAYPGEITRIPSNEITMQGVDYPVLGISDTGDTQMMQPGKDYTFDGSSVTEIPMMQKGGKAKKFLTELSTAMMTSLGNPALAIPKMVEPTVDLAASTLAPYETVEQREDIFRRYRPIEYPNPVNIIRGLLYPDEQGKPGLDPQKDLNLGEEAWRKALDLPTKQKYIVQSKYKPSTSKDKNKEYYTLKDVIDPEKVIAEAKRQGWKPGAEYQMESLKPLILDKDFSWSKDFSDIDPLQRFKMSIDPKGEYVSIYDIYDFDFPGVNKMIKPYEFYDRFYLPKTKSTKKKQNGGWLNKYE